MESPERNVGSGKGVAGLSRFETCTFLRERLGGEVPVL
jgi:hypothetical protein